MLEIWEEKGCELCWHVLHSMRSCPYITLLQQMQMSCRVRSVLVVCFPDPWDPPAPYYPIGREGAYILQSNVTQAPDHQGIDTPTTITYPPMSCRKTNGLYQNHYPFSTPILCKSSVKRSCTLVSNKETSVWGRIAHILPKSNSRENLNVVEYCVRSVSPFLL